MYPIDVSDNKETTKNFLIVAKKFTSRSTKIFIELMAALLEMKK